MITVSAGFKTAVKGDAPERRAKIGLFSSELLFEDGVQVLFEDTKEALLEGFGGVEEPDTIMEGDDDLLGVGILSNGGLCRTVIREANIKFTGSYSLLKEYLSICIGVVKADTTVEYIDYGRFQVVEVEEDRDKEQTKAKCYDHMYDSLKTYVPVDVVYPCTLKQFLEGICNAFSWTLGTTTFYNQNLEVTEDYYTDREITYREILEEIAEATGTIIYFDTDNELTLKKVGGASLETLDSEVLRKLKIEPEWGELNFLTIKTVEGVTVFRQDAAKVASFGLFGLNFQRNAILSPDIYNVIEPLLDDLKGLKFAITDSSTVGLGYFEIGDIITVKDLQLNEYDIVITDIEIDLQGGMKEIIKCQRPEKEKTDHQKVAGIIRIDELGVEKLTTGTIGIDTTIVLRDEGIDRILLGKID